MKLLPEGSSSLTAEREPLVEEKGLDIKKIKGEGLCLDENEETEEELSNG